MCRRPVVQVVTNSHLCYNGGRSRGRVRLIVMLYLYLVVTFLLDRVSKLLVVDGLPPGHSAPLIGDVVRLTHVRNTGAAFGILSGQTYFFVAVTVFLAGAILWFYHRSPYGRFINGVAAGLIVGGALGNLVDRIIWGFVVDFIDLRVWPVFNIADAAIVVGGAIMIIHYYRTVEADSPAGTETEEVSD